MKYKYNKINFFSYLLYYLDSKRKIIFFLFLSILFGLLSFVYYSPNNQINQNDKNIFVIVDENISNRNKEKKLNNSLIKSIDSSDLINNNLFLAQNDIKEEFALVVGTYKVKCNALNFEKEMKMKGFENCKIIINEDLKKYWVALNLYSQKEDAVLAKDRLLIFNDSWIKKM